MNKLARLMFLIIIIGCAQDQTETGAKVDSSQNIARKAESKIRVCRAVICNSGSYGYVTRGSGFFNPSTAIEGYAVERIEDGKVVEVYYCVKQDVPKFVAFVESAINPTDSICEKYNHDTTGFAVGTANPINKTGTHYYEWKEIKQADTVVVKRGS